MAQMLVGGIKVSEVEEARSGTGVRDSQEAEAEDSDEHVLLVPPEIWASCDGQQ